MPCKPLAGVVFPVDSDTLDRLGAVGPSQPHYPSSTLGVGRWWLMPGWGGQDWHVAVAAQLLWGQMLLCPAKNLFPLAQG